MMSRHFHLGSSVTNKKIRIAYLEVNARFGYKSVFFQSALHFSGIQDFVNTYCGYFYYLSLLSPS